MCTMTSYLLRPSVAESTSVIMSGYCALLQRMLGIVTVAFNVTFVYND